MKMEKKSSENYFCKTLFSKKNLSGQNILSLKAILPFLNKKKI
jgi:hypothetical protein